MRAKPGQGERAAYKAKWYLANREEIAANHRRYQQEHREEIRDYRKLYARKIYGWKPWRKGRPGGPPLSAKGAK